MFDDYGPESHDQPKFAVEFLHNLEVNLYYYGWRSARPDLDIRHCTVSQFLHHVDTLQLCEGLEKNTAGLVDHIVTRRAQKHGENMPSVSTLCARIKNLENRVKELLEDKQSFVEIDDDMAKDFSDIMSDGIKRDEIDDFHRLFWREQQKLSGASPSGVRFHPEIIKNVYHTSAGIQPHVIDEIKKRCLSMEPSERYVALSVDEMKIKENLVYCAATDSMVGFVDLGNSRNKKSGESTATHALQFYVRSIVGSWSRPFVFYATPNITADHLASMFWECVASLQGCGLSVIAVIADGASCNRKMFSIINNSQQEIPHKCVNVYNPEVPIFLISDPPHLLKTACNNIRGSKPGGPRLLKYGPHFIEWFHFLQVPRMFKSTELRSCKLREGHFSTQSFAKMRVCYAAQLLSGSVARLMKARGGDAMVRTAWFADLMNRWFDCMNTRHWYGHNKDQKPIQAKDDERLSWLINVFLKEIENWKNSLEGTKAEKIKMFLSFQTYEGLVGTTKAVVGLVNFLLDNCKQGTSILTKRLNQDPLEAYFGHMRQVGRRSEAPDLNQYAQYENIITTKKSIKALKGSNVRYKMNWKGAPVSDEKLPKRKAIPRVDGAE